jgi:hypothetical protein
VFRFREWETIYPTADTAISSGVLSGVDQCGQRIRRRG